MLPSLFKEERRSKERRERFALGHKKGKSSEKHTKNTIFSNVLLVFSEGLARIASESLMSLFLKSDSLTIALV